MVWGEAYPFFGFNESAQKDKLDIALPPPQYPEQKNLIEFIPNAASAHQFFLDRNSISFSSDEIIRYSLRIKSAQGSETTSFEGIRCLPIPERKIYAFGRPDKQWVMSKHANWAPLNLASTPSHIRYLSHSLFCADEVIKSANVLKEIMKKLDSVHAP